MTAILALGCCLEVLLSNVQFHTLGFTSFMLKCWIFTLMEVVRMLEWINYTGGILGYSNQLRVMLMFPSGDDFFNMNKLVDFGEIPDFQHNQPTNIAWYLEWM